MSTLAPHRTPTTALNDLLSIAPLDGGWIKDLFDLAARVKASPGTFAGALAGTSVVMLFEKPSLRTRVSFEVGLTRLGAHVMYFDHCSGRIGQRESIKDYAKNLERWVDAIVARVFEHDVLEELAEHASIPVVNALSDLEHPCQALADLFTLKEHLGTLEGARLAWVGDGNNVCHSLILTAAKLGVDVTVVTPRGFEPQFAVLRRALSAAQGTGARIMLSHDLAAVQSHHAVYTDAWISMGQGHQSQMRSESFTGFQVDPEVMAMASSGIEGKALFMHCLPAHRGQEVTDDVIDSPQSIVYDQAENRMHVQDALMLRLLGGSSIG